MEKFKKIAFLFPGQGAQIVGMGKDFFDVYPEAKAVFQEADSILERNLSKVIFEGPDEVLLETHNSQTGIYVTSIAILHVLRKQFPGLCSRACSGLSLGEYTALTASGFLPFQNALPLVQARGEYMQKACLEYPGSMAAIFGLSAVDVEKLVSDLELPRDLWVANFNCPGQTVISGTLKGVEKGIELAKQRGAKRAIPLRVQGAFHSGLMRPAQEKLAPLIRSLDLANASIPVVMNVPGDFVSDRERVKENIISQVTHSVKWQQGILAMQDFDLFLEIGCGKTLTAFNKQMLPESTTLNINQISDLERLSEILTK